MTELMKENKLAKSIDEMCNAFEESQQEVGRLERENSQLKAQLTWRSAINEPPKNEGQQLCRWSWQDNCHFRHYDLRFGWGNVTEKEIKDLLWLPIPKE